MVQSIGNRENVIYYAKIMNTDKKTDSKGEHDFHGAAIVDKDGKEVPITENMVQDACKKLANKVLGARKKLTKKSISGNKKQD